MSLVGRMTPYLAHRSRVIACKALLSDGQSNPEKRAGEKHIQFKASRIGFDRQYLVARMVIHSRKANPNP